LRVAKTPTNEQVKGRRLELTLGHTQLLQSFHTFTGLQVFFHLNLPTLLYFASLNLDLFIDFDLQLALCPSTKNLPYRPPFDLFHTQHS
jgi:hypothetical protein